MGNLTENIKKEKVLFVNCCISAHEVSRTKRLADAFLQAYADSHPESETEEIRLEELDLKPLTAEMIRTRDHLSAACVKGVEEFREAERFASADLIVIAAPYWEMSFPALLRIYIEQISALSVTFRYGEQGQSVGLCKARHMVYLTTAGGPVGDRDYGGDYLKAMCGVYGIPAFTSVAAEFLDVQGMDTEAQLALAVSKAEALSKTI